MVIVAAEGVAVSALRLYDFLIVCSWASSSNYLSWFPYLESVCNNSTDLIGQLGGLNEDL